MSSILEPLTNDWTATRLAERFGPIPLYRIRTSPRPGMATEDDVVEIHAREDRLCELVDGILVEKAMGAYESMLAVEIAALLRNWVKPRKLGTALGEAGMLRLAPGLVRIPDVAFLSMEKFPRGRFPKGAIAALAPDIVIEVLSDSNTKQEMDEKLEDYFSHGARLVWYVDPPPRTIEVYTGLVTPPRLLTEADVLDGGEVLPGFDLSIRELFAELPPE
jgi:Uma2 family endonuclease